MIRSLRTSLVFFTNLIEDCFLKSSEGSLVREIGVCEIPFRIAGRNLATVIEDALRLFIFSQIGIASSGSIDFSRGPGQASLPWRSLQGKPI